MVDHPLVDAFETATKDGHAGAGGQILRHRLIKPPPARRHIEDGPASGGTGHRILDCGADDIGAHDHTCAAARGGVVNISVFAYAVAAQIMGAQLPCAFLQGAARQAGPQHTGE